MNTIVLKLKHNFHSVAAVTLVILYSVGLVGFVLNDPLIINLTPANLLISMLVLIWTFREIQNIWWASSTIFLIGLLIEIIGVKTGFPFGTYEYHEVFGPQIFDTPWLIGINWLILVFGSRALVDRYLPRWTVWKKITIASAIMVFLDFLIEPVAIYYRFWSWEASIVPLANFLSWYLISAIMHALFYRLVRLYKSGLAILILALQFLFFGILNVYLIVK